MPDESLSIRLGLVEQHRISSHVLPRFFGFGFEKSFPTSSAASRFFSVPAEDNFFSPDAITNEMLGIRGIACHRLACVASLAIVWHAWHCLPSFGIVWQAWHRFFVFVCSAPRSTIFLKGLMSFPFDATVCFQQSLVCK